MINVVFFLDNEFHSVELSSRGNKQPPKMAITFRGARSELSLYMPSSFAGPWYHFEIMRGPVNITVTVQLYNLYTKRVPTKPTKRSLNQ